MKKSLVHNKFAKKCKWLQQLINFWVNRNRIHLQRWYKYLFNCKGDRLLKIAISLYQVIFGVIYWSKVLTDQQGLCRVFRKHKIVNNLKTATIKQVIIHLTNLLKCFFQKSHYVIFWSKNGKYPTQIRAFYFTIVDYPVYWTFKITLSSIGFEWKKVLIC